MTTELVLYHVAFLGVLALLTQSLNLVWKVNLFSLGHHGYFAIGAYAAGILTKVALNGGTSWSFDGRRWVGSAVFLASIAAAGLAAAAVGWLTVHVFGRLRGDYFAVATLILAEIVQNVAANWSYVGGGLGFEVPYLFLDNTPGERLLYGGFYAAVLVGANALLFLMIGRLQGSVAGLYVTATRDDDLAAELSGVHVPGLQRLVFTLMTAVAGVAGGVFLHFTSLIVPGDFSFINGIPVILYVVLGQLGTVRPLIAAATVYTIYELLKLRLFGLLDSWFGQLVADWKEVIFALVLIAAVVGPVLVQDLGLGRRLGRGRRWRPADGSGA